MTNITKFNYDLKQGWTLDQYVDGEGKETLVFCKNDKEEIVLNNESVKTLRDIFRKAN